jgi:hypothetical protein
MPRAWQTMKAALSASISARSRSVVMREVSWRQTCPSSFLH